MDMTLLIVLRMLERVVAVMIGGLSIYLGYQLFVKIPVQTDTSSGKFKLPWNISIVLSRVGPGVFFAAFGTIVVGTSFYRQIHFGEPAEIGRSHNDPNSALVRPTFVGAGSELGDNNAEARRDARTMLRRDMAILNTLPAQLDRNLSQQDRSMALAAIIRVKFELMEPLWDQSEWGDKSKFKDWIDAGEPDAPLDLSKAAVEYFRYPRKEAKR